MLARVNANTKGLVAAATFLTFLLLISTVGPRANADEAETKFAALDSGVSGIVPHYAVDIALTQHEVDSAKEELAHSSNACAIWQLKHDVEWKQGFVDNMRERCVQAFDSAGALPEAPLSFTQRGQSIRESCSDPWRFPRDFAGLVATVRCGDDGSFRLPLPPGHYAVFVGWWYVGHSLSTNPWWQFVDVKPHEWNQLIPPISYQRQQPCKLDWDCANGMVCSSQPGFDGKVCGERSRPIRPEYDSGVDGDIGAGPPTEYQCVEAFPEHSDLMSACAQCSGSGEFKMPLAPGRYNLELRGFWYPSRRKTVNVEIAPHQWKRLSVPLLEPRPPETPCAIKGVAVGSQH